jgi:hypothetical protein
LCIIPYQGFTLYDPCNLVFRRSEGYVPQGLSDFEAVEEFLYTSLDLYAFIAFTASASTLNSLIAMIILDNDRRQLEIDEEGIDSRRSLDVSALSRQCLDVYP